MKSINVNGVQEQLIYNNFGNSDNATISQKILSDEYLKIFGINSTKLNDAISKSKAVEYDKIFIQIPNIFISNVSKIKWLSTGDDVKFYKIDISDPSNVTYELILDISVDSSTAYQIMSVDVDITLKENEYIGIYGSLLFSSNPDDIKDYIAVAYTISTNKLGNYANQALWYEVLPNDSLSDEIENIKENINNKNSHIDFNSQYKNTFFQIDTENLFAIDLNITNSIKQSTIYIPDNNAKFKFKFSASNKSIAKISFVETHLDGGNRYGSYFSIDNLNLYVHLSLNKPYFEESSVKYTYPLGWNLSDFPTLWSYFEIERDYELFTLKVYSEDLSNTFITKIKSQPMKFVDFQHGIVDIDLGLCHGCVNIDGVVLEGIQYLHTISPRIVILGDSISEGFGSVTKCCRYGELLNRLFIGNCLNLSVAGANATNYGLTIIDNITMLHPEYFIIFLGTNGDSNFLNSMTTLISAALEQSIKGVVLCTVPGSSGSTNFIISNYSNVENVYIADLYSVLSPNGIRKEEYYLNTDMQGNQYTDVHPNEKGHLAIYEIIIKCCTFE